MKKLFNHLFLLSFMAITCSATAQRIEVKQSISPNDVVAIAQQELSRTLQLIEPDQLQDFGFETTDNFNEVKIGRPFYVTNLPKQTTGEDVVLNPYTIMVPVLLNQVARCVLYISQEEGSWKVVGIGEGNFVASQKEIFSTTTNDDGSSFVIVSIPQQTQMFLMESNDSFKPLQSFENASTTTISFASLMEINNLPVLEAAPVSKQGDINQMNDQPTEQK